MAYVKNNCGSFSLCEKYKDPETGKVRVRVLCPLGPYENLETALRVMPDDLAEISKSIASVNEALELNPYNRHNRSEWARMERLRAIWQAQYDRVLAYVARQQPHEPGESADVRPDRHSSSIE